jgi:hypothetical protein
VFFERFSKPQERAKKAIFEGFFDTFLEQLFWQPLKKIW